MTVMDMIEIKSTGYIMAIPHCSSDCCGGFGVFVLEGEGAAFSGPPIGEYRACQGEPEHLGRLVMNMLRDKPGSTVTVTVTLAPWAKLARSEA